MSRPALMLYQVVGTATYLFFCGISCGLWTLFWTLSYASRWSAWVKPRCATSDRTCSSRSATTRSGFRSLPVVLPADRLAVEPPCCRARDESVLCIC